MNKIYLTFVLLFFCLPGWASQPDAVLANQARALLASVEGTEPEGLTSLHRQIDIDIQAEEVVTTVTLIWFYPDQATVQDSGFESLYFNPTLETLEIVSAGTINAQGTVTWLDDNTLKTIDDDSYNTFTDGKRLILSYPGVSVNGVSMVRYKKRFRRTDTMPEWTWRGYPQTLNNTLHYVLSVHWPQGQTVLTQNNSDFLRCTQAPGQLLCEGRDIPKASTDDDVAWVDELGNVAVTTWPDWTSVQKKVMSGFTQAMMADDGVAEFTRDLTADYADLNNKIARIHNFVARDIRYVSMSDNGHAIVPHNVSDTLRNRYGDCKDKTALLNVMLAQIGIKASPTLIATERSNPDNVQVPAINVFDHVVSCFVKNGNQYCLDATDAYTPWQTTSDWIQNRVSLPLTGEARLAVLHADPFRWQLDTATVIEFDTQGGQHEQQTIKWQNAYETQVRSKLAGMSKKERVKWATELYEDIVAEGAEPSFDIQGINSLNEGLTFTSDTEFTPYYDPADGIDLEETDAWINHELSTATINNTTYAHFFPGSNVKSSYTLIFPAGWSVERLPIELDLQHVMGQLQRRVESSVNHNNQQVVVVTTVLKIPSGWVQPAQFETFNKMVYIFTDQSMISFGN